MPETDKSNKGNEMIDSRLQKTPTCLLCGKQGQLLYRQLCDRLFAVEGRWDLSWCQECDLTWLNPRPASQDIPEMYQTYYTHRSGNDWASKVAAGEPLSKLSYMERVQLALFAKYSGYRFASEGMPSPALISLLWAMPMIRDIAKGRSGWIEPQQGRLLDVGCGNGEFLALMDLAGWDVIGIEPDAQACQMARDRFQLPVFQGTLETVKLEPGAFDAITAFHVVEHMEHPFKLVSQGLHLLKPDGQMTIVTPNLSGLGHRLFRSLFRDLDPPRHLYLFSPRALRQGITQAGGKIVSLKSSARHARWVWVDSINIRRGERIGAKATRRQVISGMLFQAFEDLVRGLMPMAGDELIAVISRG